MKACRVCKDRGDFPKLLLQHKLTSLAVEVGVRRGDFAKILLQGWPGTVHMVDPWMPMVEYSDNGDQDPSWEDEKDYQRVVQLAAQHSDRAVVHRCTSVEALCRVPDNLDFVYVDANHAYNYVWQDLRLWYDKLHCGGILAGHDFLYTQQLDVTQAVVEFAYERGLTINVVYGSSDNSCLDGQVSSWYTVKR